jgi:hypothetical protein
MGWKNLKEAFNIDRHHVVVQDGNIQIGSGFVHDLVVVDTQTGEVRQNKTFSDFLSKEYPALERASQARILDLIRTPDTFENSIPVFTFRDGEIIECQCEELGYPNVTHDGRIMKRNRFSSDIDEVVAWAKRDLEAWSDMLDRRKQEIESELASIKDSLGFAKRKYLDLCAQYPQTSHSE